MTVLDKFLTFAKGLPADQLASVEESLAALMESMEPKYDFSAAELADLKARLAEPDPAYSDPADVARIFGKPFRA